MRKLVGLAALLLFALAGCGGGGAEGPGTVEAATVQISWPARSRDPLVHNLSSAQSVTITLQDASTAGEDVVIRVDRDETQTDAYVGTYTVSEALRKSDTTLTATFFALPGQEGEVVGTATAMVDFGGDTLQIASVAVEAEIATVTVVDPGTLTVGQSKQLLAAAQDDTGAAVAVTPGSTTWSLASGTSITLTPNGTANAVAVGSSTVVATIDGKASTPATINVAEATISEPNFKIAWPDRTRGSLEHGLTSALSAQVTLVDGAADGSDIVVTVNRDETKPESHTATYSVGQAVRAGLTTLTAKFYGGRDAADAMVGTASAAVSPTEAELTLSNIVLDGKIKSVSVTNTGPFQPGDTVQLYAETRDADSNLLVVTPGSFKWTVIGGGENISITTDGFLSAQQAGTAEVKVEVDGVQSPARTLVVQEPGGDPSVQIVDLSVADMTYNEATGKIWASVLANDAKYPNSIVSINPTNGQIGDPIAAGGTPGQIAVSDDGKYVYTNIGNTTVRRFSVLTHAEDSSFTVDEGEIVDLEAVPGKPRSYAIATDPIGGVNFSVWNDADRLSGTGAVGYRIHFASSTVAYGDGRDSLFRNTVSDTQVNWTNQYGLNVNGMDYAAGLIFTAQGNVIDPETQGVVRTMSSGNFLIDRILTASEHDNRVYYTSWDPTHGKRILTFNLTTGTELAPFSTTIDIGGAQNMIACGNRTVAFHLFGPGGVKRTPFIVRNLP